MGSQRALGRRARSAGALDADVVALVDRVTRRLRAAGRVGRTVVLRLRFDDFSRATRSHTLARATADTHTVLETVRELLAAARPLVDEHGLTMVGVAVSNLDDDRAVQLALPFDRPRRSTLDAAVDAVKARFGGASLTRAVLLGHDPGVSMPQLPD
jgi:DNA polymerase-4